MPSIGLPIREWSASYFIPPDTYSPITNYATRLTIDFVADKRIICSTIVHYEIANLMNLDEDMRATLINRMLIV